MSSPTRPNSSPEKKDDDNQSEGFVPNLSEEEHEVEHEQHDANKEAALFILKQIITLLKISLETSSKVISPAINQMLQSIIPVIAYYYQKIAPSRIQEWLQIVTSALQNIFNILSQTQAGKDLLSQFNAVNSNTMHLLTSVNTRQIIIEGVGMHVKAIEALRTPEMKTFLTSLPVFYIRFLDIVSSGEAKLLYHSMTALIWKTIDLLGQDETTLALAEVTALLVNALERERECYGPWNRKPMKVRKKKGVRLSSLLHRRNTGAAASNSKRRYERNKSIAETYTNRVILKESLDDDGSMYGDNTVEDAILSSLGDNTRSDHAWVTSLGRDDSGHGVDVAVPRRVILPKIEGNASSHSAGSIHFDDLEGASEQDDDESAAAQEENIAAGAVNLSYLRDGIKKRHEQVNRNGDGYRNGYIQKTEQSNNLSTMSVAGDSVLSDESQFAIEDLVINANNSSATPRNPPKRKVYNLNMQDLVLEDESVDTPTIIHADDANLKHGKRREGTARGTYSSVSHFYRALDDMQTKMRDTKISTSLKRSNGEEEVPGVSTSSSGTKKWQSKAAAAAGAGNERGQNVLRSGICRGYSRASSQPIRFRANVQTGNEAEDEAEKCITLVGVARSLMMVMPMKSKLFIGTIAIFFFMIFVWFLLGCYGLYFLVHQTFSNQVTPLQNEIILRIIQDPSAGNWQDKEKLVTAAADAIHRVIQDRFREEI